MVVLRKLRVTDLVSLLYLAFFSIALLRSTSVLNTQLVFIFDRLLYAIPFALIVLIGCTTRLKVNRFYSFWLFFLSALFLTKYLLETSGANSLSLVSSPLFFLYQKVLGYLIVGVAVYSTVLYLSIERTIKLIWIGFSVVFILLVLDYSILDLPRYHTAAEDPVTSNSLEMYELTRFSGIYSNQNSLGMFLFVYTILTIHMIRAYTIKPLLKNVLVILAGASVLFLLATSSRTALSCLVIGVIVYFYIQRFSLKLFFGICISVFLLVLSLQLTDSGIFILERFSSGGVSGRDSLWLIAVDLWLMNPFFGIDKYTTNIGSIVGYGELSFHSFYVFLLLNYGLVGLILWIIPFFYLVSRFLLSSFNKVNQLDEASIIAALLVSISAHQAFELHLNGSFHYFTILILQCLSCGFILFSSRIR